MKQYANYVFDLYGTLVDIHTDERKKSLWQRMSLFYGYYGAHYQPEELQQAYLRLVGEKESEMRTVSGASGQNAHYAHEAYPEIAIGEVFGQLYTMKGVEARDELVLHTGQMFRVFSTGYIRLYAHAKELLQALHEAGRKVYLLSNAQRIFTEYELRYLEIYPLFDGILISSEEGCKKPDKRFFELLFTRYGIRAEESLMIGNDLESDIAGARQAGMDSYYLHSGISPKADQEKLEKAGAAQGNPGSAYTKVTGATYVMERLNLLTLERKLMG